MGKYQVKSPDGATFEVEAPDGASEDEVLAYAQEHFAGQSKSQASAPAASAPAQGKPEVHRGGPSTYASMEMALQDLYPGKVKVNSRRRTREHNEELRRQGLPAAQNSLHIDGYGLDIAPIPGVPIEQVAKDLKSRGFNVVENLYHNNHYHLAADKYQRPADYTPDQKRFYAQVNDMYKRGDSEEDIRAFMESNGSGIGPADGWQKMFELRKAGKPGVFVPSESPAAPPVDPDNPAGVAPPPEAEGDGGEGLLRKPSVLMQGVNKGIAGLLGAPVDAVTWGANKLLPEGHEIQNPIGGSDSIKGLLAKLGVMDESYDPRTKTEEYIASAGEGVGSSIVPGLGLTARGGQVLNAGVNAFKGNAGKQALDKIAATMAANPKAAIALETASGAGSGIGGQVADDVAPGNPLVRFGLETAGAAAGGGLPLVPKGLRAVGDARFVSKQAKHKPYAAYDAEIAKELDGLVKETARSPTDPKGRAVVTVTEVNALERSYLTGFKERLNALDISQPEKRKLIDAIEQRHAISMKDVEALRGTVQGDAVADSLTKIQRLRHLTPEVPRGGVSGTMKTVLEQGANVAGASTTGPFGAVTGSVLRKFLSNNADAEAARVHSAERVIKRKPAYDKLAERVGPSGQRESQQALDKLYTDTVEGKAAAQEATLQAKAQAAQARQQAQALKEDKRIARGGLTDQQFVKDTFRRPSPVEDVLGRKPASILSEADLAKLEKGPEAFDKTLAKAERSDKRLARGGLTDERFFKASIRPAPGTAPAPLDSVLGHPPKKMLTEAALRKLEQATVSSKTATAIDRLGLPKRRTPEDLAIEVNIAQGLKGSGGSTRAYASMLGVPEKDMLRALDKIEVEPDFSFEVAKLRHGFPVKRSVQGALLPRLTKVLTEDGTLAAVKEQSAKTNTLAEARMAEAAQRGEVTPGILTDEATNSSAKPAKAKAPVREATPAPERVMRGVDRPKQWDAAAKRFVAKADEAIQGLYGDAGVESRTLETIDGVPQRIRDNFRTTEEAVAFFEDDVVPDLMMDRVSPEQIELLRKHVHRIASNKRYATVAEYEEGTAARPRGRPPKKD